MGERWAVFRGDDYTWEVLPASEKSLYIGQEMYPSREAALNALLASLEQARRSMTFSIRRVRRALREKPHD